MVCLWTFFEENAKLFIICALTRDNGQRKEKTAIAFKKKKPQLFYEVEMCPVKKKTTIASEFQVRSSTLIVVLKEKQREIQG